MNQSKTTIAGLAVMLAIGFLIGRSTQSTEANAQQRTSQPRVAFKSGGEMAAETLVVISATLKQMDERLARIESHVTLPTSGQTRTDSR